MPLGVYIITHQETPHKPQKYTQKPRKENRHTNPFPTDPETPKRRDNCQFQDLTIFAI